MDGAVSSAGFEVSRGYSHFPRYSTVMDEKMKHMLTLANSEDIGENVLQHKLRYCLCSSSKYPGI